MFPALLPIGYFFLRPGLYFPVAHGLQLYLHDGSGVVRAVEAVTGSGGVGE